MAVIIRGLVVIGRVGSHPAAITRDAYDFAALAQYLLKPVGLRVTGANRSHRFWVDRTGARHHDPGAWGAARWSAACLRPSSRGLAVVESTYLDDIQLSAVKGDGTATRIVLARNGDCAAA